MKTYLQKSLDNLKASDTLVNGTCDTASAHSAYYALFSLTKYVLNAKLGCAYVEQDALKEDKDSHNKLQCLFFKKLSSIPDFEINDFLVRFNTVRKLRNLADYKPEEIPHDHLENNNKDAHDFVEGLNNKFNLY